MILNLTRNVGGEQISTSTLKLFLLSNPQVS